MLCNENKKNWSFSGAGRMEIPIGPDSDNKNICFSAPVIAEHWPLGSPEDGDYSNFGTSGLVLSLTGKSWEEYNRLAFSVKPNCPGIYSVHLIIALKNEGVEKIPDSYQREGYHVVNLENHQWNNCLWEFPELPRDKITELSISVLLCGKEIGSDDSHFFEFSKIDLESVHNPEPWQGWDVSEGSCIYSTSGYWKNGTKTALIETDETQFNIFSMSDNTIVFTGDISKVKTLRGEFSEINFSGLKEAGLYYIQAGEIKTPPFPISNQPFSEAVWKAVNFLFTERCGYPVPGKHGSCHHDLIAEKDGKKLIFNGGWHDAGDVSQQLLQSAEIVQSLLELAITFKNDKTLKGRILEEAQWGLDFVLRMRFGDGNRATSAGATRWTQNFIGDMDDVDVRVHNHALENFFCAGMEACASAVFKQSNPGLAARCLDIGKKDFMFALDRYWEYGLELPNMYEHSFNASQSQLYSIACRASTELYSVTNDDFYKEQALKFANLLLECQDKGEAGLPFRGFFYRDTNKKTLVHFNHQSREHVFIQALGALVETFPEHSEKTRWLSAMSDYGDYLKAISAHTAPYGMIPAGVHQISEAEDKELFEKMHLLCNYEQEKSNYIEQIKEGDFLDRNYYLRCFPLWFSFRGNTAVHLSSGKAAAILGRILKDPVLRDIGREQIYWIAGKNPFGQSLMYGEGNNFPEQYSIFSGNILGAIPVGIQTRGNDDIPFWPQGNNATYKEVWTSSIGRWIWLMAELRKED